MKIGILTLPLSSNYGGILQAYALQSVLQSMGHTVFLINRESRHTSSSFLPRLSNDIKYFLRILLNKTNYGLSSTRRKRLTHNIKRFISNRFNCSPSLYCDSKFISYLSKQQFDAIVVGSDQVWRASYTENIYNYFLDINDINLKKISYAASFGEDNWLYNEMQTQKIKQLIHEFSGVSVREASAIELCKHFLDVDADLVLDPTLLLSKVDYTSLTNISNNPKNNLFCYILDKSEEKNEIIRNISSGLDINDINHFQSVPLENSHVKALPKNFALPSVENWIESFYDAAYIITDSFHGMAFSIIFNKPFWVILNSHRGSTRFESLLSQLDLLDRILPDLKKNESFDFRQPIDWDRVNKKIKDLRDLSLTYLTNVLKRN